MRDAVTKKLSGRCEVLYVPSGSLASKRAFVDQHLKTGDVLLSLHLNAGVPSATGVEVLYDDGAPANAEEAADISLALSNGLKLRNRGAKRDTQAAVGNVLILGGKGRRYLAELAFISNPADVAALRTYGVDTLVGIIDTLLHLAPMPTSNPEFDDAFLKMQQMGVFSAFTKKSDVITAEKLAVFLARFKAAAGL